MAAKISICSGAPGEMHGWGQAWVRGWPAQVSGGAPPPSRGTRRSFQTASQKHLRDPPLERRRPLHPLRSEAKGQAGACPDRTRAIPCKVRVRHDGRKAGRARCVPDQPVNTGKSRSIRNNAIHRLTCERAG